MPPSDSPQSSFLSRFTSRLNTSILLPITFLLFLGVYLPALDRVPTVAVDEAWCGNTIANIAHGNGIINTNGYEWGNQNACFYPLAIGFPMGILHSPTDLVHIRTASVVLGLLSLAVLMAIAFEFDFSPLETFFLSSIWMTSTTYFIVFRWIRTEPLITLLLLIAIFFWIKAHRTRSPLPWFAAGLSLSIGFFAHPLAAIPGLVMGLSALIESFNRKTLRPLLGYGIGSLLGLSCFMAVVLVIKKTSPIDEMTHFLLASHRSSLNAGSHFFQFFIQNTKDFIATYTMGWARTYILVFEWTVLVLGLAMRKKIPEAGLLGSLGLGSTLFGLLILNPFHRRYFVIISVLSLLTAFLIIRYLISKKRKGATVLIGFLIALYALNQGAGTAALIYRSLHNTPFSNIENQLQKYIPPHQTVLGFMPLWFGLQESRFFCELTSWSFTPYPDLDTFIAHNQADYVVLSDLMAQYDSPITGEKAIHPVNGTADYYNAVLRYAETQGQLLQTLNTTGYGTISIWKIRK